MQIMKEAKKFVDTNDFSWIDDKYRKSLIKEQEEKVRQHGIAEGIVNVAKNMLKNNFSKNQIIEVTGLSKEELDKLN